MQSRHHHKHRFMLLMLSAAAMLVTAACITPVIQASPPPVVVSHTSVSYQPDEVTVHDFERELTPYGQWLYVPGVGRVWRPYESVVGRNFQPYSTGGHWVLTHHGWVFSTQWAWGWAPFHYGRWTLHNAYGWVWLPDTVWAPAWVDWRVGDGYVGWAPLPPAGMAVNAFGPSWIFIESRHFGVSIWHNHIIRGPRVQTVWSRTRPHRHRIERGRTYWYEGPSRKYVKHPRVRELPPSSRRVRPQPQRPAAIQRPAVQRPAVQRPSNRPEPRRPEAVRPEPVRPTPSRPAPSRQETRPDTRPNRNRVEPSRPSPSRPASRPAPARPAPSRPGEARPSPSSSSVRPATTRPSPAASAPRLVRPSSSSNTRQSNVRPSSSSNNRNRGSSNVRPAPSRANSESAGQRPILVRPSRN